jgi:hypothetical protein
MAKLPAAGNAPPPKAGCFLALERSTSRRLRRRAQDMTSISAKDETALRPVRRFSGGRAGTRDAPTRHAGPSPPRAKSVLRADAARLTSVPMTPANQPLLRIARLPAQSRLITTNPSGCARVSWSYNCRTGIRAGRHLQINSRQARRLAYGGWLHASLAHPWHLEMRRG